MATNRVNFDYAEILEHFGEEKIGKRYESLENHLLSFIERENYQEKVRVSFGVLYQVMLDYFADIYRLKEFHKIEHINFIKIHAYTAYWLLRRKPIQIVQENEDDVELAFVNENFITSYLVHFLNEEAPNTVIKSEYRADYNSFLKNLRYTLRYRIVTAQSLETMLEAYLAGRRFECSK